MINKEKDEKKIDVGTLAFYFDSQEKDSLDHGRLGRKTGQVLALREKLLAMPEAEFDMAIRTIEKLVSGVNANMTMDKERKDRKERRSNAQELYERSSKVTTPEVRKI